MDNIPATLLKCFNSSKNSIISEEIFPISEEDLKQPSNKKSSGKINF